MMTDAARAIVWEIENRPFGDGATVTGTATLNLRFPGQYYDAESGLNYNYFRDYNPAVGRYVEADPIGLRGGINPFAFVLNDPVNWVDSEGMSPKNRVNWALKQYKNNKKFWKGRVLGKKNKCNEFVAATHNQGDPDATDYPTVLRNDGYIMPIVEDLANPNFARSRLDFLPIKDVQPGDIVVWFGKGVHHTALYVGDGTVIYQNFKAGLKFNTVEGYSEASGFSGVPIVRRYKY